MQTIKINPRKINKYNLEFIADNFKEKKVIVYPAETIYGIGGIASDNRVIKKIYKLKKRDTSKTFIILVGSFCMLKKYFFVNAKQDKFLRNVWPKPFGTKRVRPTTVILKSRGILPKVLEKNSTIAVRLPMANQWGRDFLIPLIKKIDEPIISTSLNISGQKPIDDLKNIEKIFPQVDLVVDRGKLPSRRPSRIIDLTDIENVKIIR